MITINIQNREVLARINRLSELTQAGIEYGCWVSGNGLVKATSREILRKPKGGRTYRIRDSAGRRRRHVASAPGETHANITGKARRSLSFRVGRNSLEFGYGVTKNDAPPYAEGLEFGTARMQPRPSLQNGIRSEQRNFEINLQREIGQRLGDRIQ